MINESALLESKSLRDSVLERTDVLDKVKALSLLPDGMHVTTAMVAAYFGVSAEAIRQLKARHHEELSCNGMVTLQGSELAEFKRDVLSRFPGGYPQPRSSLTLYPRRAVLNVAMLLRDSNVARQVRTYLLDMEYLARTQPVENPAPADVISLDDRVGQHITHILGKTVVPMFNALIATAGEHRRELIELREDIENVERKLCWHHRRISTLEGEAPTDQIRASIAAMTWQAFERHVADLLRRDGCTDVVVRQARSDRGIDITGRTADGRSVAVQCKNRAGRSSVPSADMQKFAGAARAVDRVDIALFVATCNFSLEAQAIADLSGVITVNRDELEAWSAGVRLKALR
ncbi:restriction endonuclease [Streptomyces sp. DT2A-34]|uniref:restriction endonuclease n=1 Tax=Streptomyces sp. DT2A-34 TaxID=3051182 RepID=UPI00265C7426|nr:restriction endonuclease [Streptomyces sp. DT2A-34]MDO0913421.1 restriction endonuclease [Streptomyces sp. DT2A-34]